MYLNDETDPSIRTIAHDPLDPSLTTRLRGRS